MFGPGLTWSEDGPNGTGMYIMLPGGGYAGDEERWMDILDAMIRLENAVQQPLAAIAVER
ncbi:hypothetical protein HN371_20930 [Candidatus Poribacteria bacterium]|nr:hypothetical protein [Candidatus Poribacteria bacterium]MBT5536585.1 hypothetical protein [Candidatus Poribacteria bacterium]MBT7805895.1 hypothetical protein [Candidatus Poribacteria bacterium]